MSQVKYKCKKSYPGGPIVGHILNPQDTWFAGMNYWWNNVWFDPKDYTEYWEKVVERDYEILEFKDTLGNIFKKDATGEFTKGSGYFDENHGIQYKFIICSVKRLSDNEIFTIGDVIGYPSITNTKIESFTVRDNKIAAWGKFIHDMNGFVLLNDVKKSKVPLLVTEDGFEIFNEGIPVIIYSRLTRNRLYCGVYFKSLHNDLGSDIIIFVDPKNASNWIEENKPQYSKHDLLSFGCYVRGYNTGATTRDCFTGWIKSPQKPST